MNDRHSAALLPRVPVVGVALAIAILAFTLIVLAGSTSSSNCEGWAECSGWSALGQRADSIAAWRLGLSGVVGLLALGLVALTRLNATNRHLSRISIVATGMAAIQLAAISMSTNVDNAPNAAAIHLGATAILLATVVYLISVVVGYPFAQVGTYPLAATSAVSLMKFRWLIIVTGLSLFTVLVSGAYLSSASPATSCTQWPLCGTNVSATMFLNPDLALIHREVVLLTGVLLVAVAVVALRSSTIAPATRWLVGLLIGSYAVEVGIGAFSATGGVSRVTDGAHFAVAAVVWVLLIGFAITLTGTLAAVRNSSDALVYPTSPSVARDYFRVMKPGIMVLLLTTTLGAMLVAGAGVGWPSFGLIIATLLGGVLASGGASALNCYLDRDIDIVMSRTRKRPLPTGRLSAEQVRNFGLVLSALAVVELAIFVNPLAAVLALSGNLYYVVLYTRFLKRSTPQNIVVGGGAGAFPPLVGWAAVTGSLGLTPVLLFALIYYWTPPHFWSLALLKARDYERASIPMLPVTHGDAQTRKFILIYSFLLVGITLLIVPASGAGALYLGAALLLGGVFVGYAARMYQERSTRLAWPLFKYSNYYLALILLALVVDRALGL